MFAAVGGALRWLTVEQYRRIDSDHRTAPNPDGKTIWTLLAIALALFLPHFYGRPHSLDKIPGAAAFVAELPYPGMVPDVYWALFKLVNYFLVPALVIKLVFRERILDYGFRGSRDKRVWLLYGAMFLFMVPVVYAASHSGAFLRTYPKYDNAAGSWVELIVWELSYGLQFLLLEFFFRGFTLFALARYVGHLAIFIMAVPYMMIHFGKPMLECAGSVFAGIALGTLSLRTRSIYGGVALHCGVAWGMDGLAMWQKGQLQKLVGL
jgi:hypothetical protein